MYALGMSGLSRLGSLLVLLRVVETETVTTDTSDFDAGLIFEQDPVQIIDALLPLYLNSTLLRSLQARALSYAEPRTTCAMVARSAGVLNQAGAL